jgi:hypothetical protein
MRSSSYVDLLVAEWGIDKHSPKVQTCMRRILSELIAESQLILRLNPKLQVVVLPEAAYSVWAYFPIHQKRTIVRHFNIRLKHKAGVLLLLSEKHIQEQSARKTNTELRHHLGHTLLYLRSPRRPNECQDADREWQESLSTNKNTRHGELTG